MGQMYKTSRKPLNESETMTVYNALIVAAQRFKDDAAVARECNEPRIAEQFDRQEVDTRALAERFEVLEDTD